MLEKSIGGAMFSLDPVDPEKPYHPFNLMRFPPPQLDESEFLNTMLLTDYILKFLTTTQEVQGQYPFEKKSVAAMIEHMPEYLRKIINDFHEAPHSGQIHRFWIEAEEITVPISEQNNQNLTRIGVNDLKMVVKKHRMERDIHGELKDVGNEDEGWPIYVLTVDQINELRLGIRAIKGPAMIFTHAEAKLIYWEHNSELHAHIPTDFRETLIRLYLQPRAQDGKIAFNTKNMPLIYKITKEMARQSGLPARYSSEFIFAHEFTAHYDEFAQYLPEFGRLKELSKMTILVSFLKRGHKNNQKSLSALDFLIDTPYLLPLKQTKMYLSFKQVQEQICKHNMAQFNEWRKEFASSVLEQKCYEQIRQIRTAIGTLYFDSSSEEVLAECERWAENAVGDNPHVPFKQLRKEVISRYANTIAIQLTKAAKTNCKKSLQEYFSEYGFASLDSLISYFIYSDIKPLANALFKHEQKSVEKQFVERFPRNLPSDLMSALNGSDAAVLKIANQEVRDYFEEEKKTCELIEIGYSNIGLGKQKEPVDLEDKCFWVPASVCHQPPVGASRHSFFVYGGVNVNPRVNVVPGGNGPLRGNQVGGVSFNNVNAQAALNLKLCQLEKAQNKAVKTQEFVDGRIRYYDVERLSRTPGPTRGNAYVTEHNPNTGRVRTWTESYDHNGNVSRVHPKSINGLNVRAQHYPPTGSEIKQQRGY